MHAHLPVDEPEALVLATADEPVALVEVMDEFGKGHDGLQDADWMATEVRRQLRTVARDTVRANHEFTKNLLQIYDLRSALRKRNARPGLAGEPRSRPGRGARKPEIKSRKSDLGLSKKDVRLPKSDLGCPNPDLGHPSSDMQFFKVRLRMAQV
ncbi:hypothetical protein GCM10007933_27410 [Zoogloea oryzae]|uniref:Transposase n=1 Tax=Zoogloea oryzae TaxID=310767 RepID=A0ABQ6FF76_9RHOO|nr:hypothetical protein GCM10007933_27410 [Zoogloea oryzae]